MMKRIVITTIMVLALMVLTVPATYAIPTLYLSDGTNVVMVYDGQTGSIIDSNPAEDAVTYNGPVGNNWLINVSTGLSLGDDREPEMDLNIIERTVLGAGTLTIMFSDDSFGPLAIGKSFTAAIGGTVAVGGAVTSYKTFLASNNRIFEVEDAILLTEQGPFATLSFNDSTNSDAFPSVVAHPYSLTQVVTIQHSRRGTSSLDANLLDPLPLDANVQVPEPSTLLLLGTGLVGMGLLRRRVKN